MRQSHLKGRTIMASLILVTTVVLAGCLAGPSEDPLLSYEIDGADLPTDEVEQKEAKCDSRIISNCDDLESDPDAPMIIEGLALEGDGSGINDVVGLSIRNVPRSIIIDSVSITGFIQPLVISTSGCDECHTVLRNVTVEGVHDLRWGVEPEGQSEEEEEEEADAAASKVHFLTPSLLPSLDAHDLLQVEMPTMSEQEDPEGVPSGSNHIPCESKSSSASMVCLGDLKGSLSIIDTQMLIPEGGEIQWSNYGMAKSHGHDGIEFQDTYLSKVTLKNVEVRADGWTNGFGIYHSTTADAEATDRSRHGTLHMENVRFHGLLEGVRIEADDIKVDGIEMVCGDHFRSSGAWLMGGTLSIKDATATGCTGIGFYTWFETTAEVQEVVAHQNNEGLFVAVIPSFVGNIKLTDSEFEGNNQTGLRLLNSIGGEVTSILAKDNGHSSECDSLREGGGVVISGKIPISITDSHFENNNCEAVKALGTGGRIVEAPNNWWNSDKGPILCTSSTTTSTVGGCCPNIYLAECVGAMVAYLPFRTAP